MTTATAKTMARKPPKNCPAYVREVLEQLEPLFAHAKGRTVIQNSREWAVHWRDVSLDAARLAMFLDLLSERPELGCTLWVSPGGWKRLTVYVSREGREDDWRRTRPGRPIQ